MASLNLLSKLDRALVAYLISQGAGTLENIFPAKRSLGKTLPITIIWAQKSTEDPPCSGDYMCDTAVMVKTPPLDSAGDADNAKRVSSDALVAAVFDELKRGLDSGSETLAAAITTAARALAVSDPTNHADLADFTALAVLDGGMEQGLNEELDVWVDTFNLQILCCGKNVS